MAVQLGVCLLFPCLLLLRACDIAATPVVERQEVQSRKAPFAKPRVNQELIHYTVQLIGANGGSILRSDNGVIQHAEPAPLLTESSQITNSGHERSSDFNGPLKSRRMKRTIWPFSSLFGYESYYDYPPPPPPASFGLFGTPFAPAPYGTGMPFGSPYRPGFGGMTGMSPTSLFAPPPNPFFDFDMGFGF